MKRSTGLVAMIAWASQVWSQSSGVQIPLNQYYGGGLTILAHNDLDNNPKNGSGAVLVHQPANYQEVAHSCQVLGETLWDPEAGNFTDGLNSSLSYQIFQGVFPETQLFWVVKEASAAGGEGGDDPRACRAIDVQGGVFKVDCITSRLPALCSQSAPVSTSRTNNEPTRFVVNQPAGDLVYHGFRDFFAWKFRGVRYAASPSRFEHSRLYEAGEAERKVPIPALNATGDCLQRVGEVQSGSTEDCLFLNIWTPYLPPLPDAPVPRPKALKPVMFYIYGGGFTSGSWKNPNTDGTMLASRGDVVVVSVNYRVGSPGWLVFDDGVHKGNYGLGDLVTALEWVKNNIGHFGGDRDRVTIFGESAGAMLVRALLASPKAKGLFYAAISQSGPTGLTDNEGGTAATYDSLRHSYTAVTEPLLKTLGYTEGADPAAAVAYVRGVNATDLINADPVARGLVIDGEYLVSNTLSLNGTVPGYTSDVAFLTGTNRDELGVDFDLPPADANLTEIISAILPPNRRGDVQSIVTHPAFAIPAEPTPEQMLAATVRIGTDGAYTCLEQATIYSAARAVASAGSFRSVHAYQFNRTYNPSGYTKPHCNSPADTGPEAGEYYKCHAGEQMVVFATVARGGLPDRDGRDLPFMRLVVDHWAAFAATRDPNPDPAYLRARGYWSTLARVEALGPWLSVAASVAEDDTARPIRLLQAESRMVGWTERAQCDALGLPLTYFEAR